MTSSTPTWRSGWPFARIVTHYFRHGAWLEEGQLLRDARRLAGIPGVLIHGRLDLGGPLVAARGCAGSSGHLVGRLRQGPGSPGLPRREE